MLKPNKLTGLATHIANSSPLPQFETKPKSRSALSLFVTILISMFIGYLIAQSKLDTTIINMFVM